MTQKHLDIKQNNLNNKFSNDHVKISENIREQIKKHVDEFVNVRTNMDYIKNKLDNFVPNTKFDKFLNDHAEITKKTIIY